MIIPCIKMSKVFDPSNLLPHSDRVIGADSHLYRIGLSLYKTQSIQRQSLIYKPFIILVILLLVLLRHIFLILKNSEPQSEEFYINLGNYAMYSMGIVLQSSYLIIASTLLPLFSQLINYLNYKNHKKQTDLKLFEMMSGLIAPKSIGLTNREDIYKIITKFKTVMKLNTILIQALFWVVFIQALVLFSPNITLFQLIFVGIPNSILWSVWSLYVTNFIFYQIIYYYFIVYYLKYKIKVINESLKRHIINNRKNSSQFLMKAINKLNDIYIEINEYDMNYWSKFLFVFWFTIEFIIVFLTFMSTFGKNQLFIRLLIGFYSLNFLSLLLFIIHISSEIFIESNKTYNILYSYINEKQLNKLHIKFKVYFIS